MSFADFDGAFRRSRANRSLSDALVSANDLDEQEFRAAVDDNLRSGRMRLIVAVDEITEELKRTVTYLNSHTTTEVELLALEMRRAVAEGVEVLLPATYGEESAREKERSAPRGQRLDRETLLAIIREHSEAAADAAEGILDWADGEPRLDVRYTPTAGVRLRTAGKPLLIISRRGQLRVVLKTLSEHGEPWDDEGIEQLVQDLAEIGVQLEPKGARPKTPLEPLADDSRRRRFLSLVERIIDALTSGP
jgi:hypothetical protein